MILFSYVLIFRGCMVTKDPLIVQMFVSFNMCLVVNISMSSLIQPDPVILIFLELYLCN